jgi:hypothetical protein
MAVSVKAAALDADAVDLHRLVRLTRLQRLARAVSRLALAALPIWLAVLVIALASTDEDGTTWNWFNDHGNRGFVIVLAVLAADLILWFVLRLATPAGRAAARFVPLLRRVPEPLALRSSPPVARGAGARRRATQEARLLDLGSRRRRAPHPDRTRAGSVMLVLTLLGFVAIAVYTAAEVRPTYRASHGRGGPVVTLGKDSRIVRREVDTGQDGPTTYNYYISSPRGVALVEGDGKPRDGTRLAVVRLNGRLRAVHVGGHSWVTDLVLAILSSVSAALMLVWIVYRAATSLGDERVIPLPVTVAALGAGESTSVRPGSSGNAIVLTVDAGTSRDAGDVVSRQRRITAALAAGILVVLALVGLLTAYA